MIKRLSAILLCLVFTLSIFGCSKDNKNETSEISHSIEPSETQEISETQEVSEIVTVPDDTAEFINVYTCTPYKLSNPTDLESDFAYAYPENPTLFLEKDGDKFLYACYDYGPAEYLYFGKYYSDGNTVVLTTQDGKHKFTLKAENDSLTADAECPLPFSGEKGIFIKDDTDFSLTVSSLLYMADQPVYWDIDNDGNKEICILSIGPTSGVFSAYLTVYDKCTLKYSGVIYWFGAQFAKTDGRISLVCGDLGEYKIDVTENGLVLTHPTEDQTYEILKP